MKGGFVRASDPSKLTLDPLSSCALLLSIPRNPNPETPPETSRERERERAGGRTGDAAASGSE